MAKLLHVKCVIARTTSTYNMDIYLTIMTKVKKPCKKVKLCNTERKIPMIERWSGRLYLNTIKANNNISQLIYKSNKNFSQNLY